MITDCSGIEAPIEALKQLNIPFQHKCCIVRVLG